MDIFLGILVSLAVFGIGVHIAMTYLPSPKRTLDQAKLSAYFHGLILFGEEGAYLKVAPSRGNGLMRFWRRARSDGSWWLELEVTDLMIPADFFEQFEARITTLAKDLACALSDSSKHEGLRITITGPGVGKPHLLESVAKIAAQCLGYDLDTTRFRVDLEGPNDEEAFRRYFGMKS